MQANPTLLRMKYARVVELFARWAGLSLEEALAKFYDSTVYELMSQGISDMHCMSDGYLAEELILEFGLKKISGFKKTHNSSKNEKGKC